MAAFEEAKPGRPKEFDAKLLAYEPMLKRMARRLVPQSDREDLVQSALYTALRKWHKCGNGFHGWLRMIMVTEYGLYKRSRQLVPLQPEETMGNQEANVDVKLALAKCANPDIMLEIGMGAHLDEIAAERGVSKQSIHAKVKRDRERIAANG